MHGLVHLVAGGLEFIAFAVACFLLARHFREQHRDVLAATGVLASIALLLGFITIAVTSGTSDAVIAFSARVVLSRAWLLVASICAYAGGRGDCP